MTAVFLLDGQISYHTKVQNHYAEYFKQLFQVQPQTAWRKWWYDSSARYPVSKEMTLVQETILKLKDGKAQIICSIPAKAWQCTIG